MLIRARYELLGRIASIGCNKPKKCQGHDGNQSVVILLFWSSKLLNMREQSSQKLNQSLHQSLDQSLHHSIEVALNSQKYQFIIRMLFPAFVD